jgi:hypothetical protein
VDCRGVLSLAASMNIWREVATRLTQSKTGPNIRWRHRLHAEDRTAGTVSLRSAGGRSAGLTIAAQRPDVD